MSKIIIDTDKACDLLPVAVDIYDKLDLTNYIKNVKKGNKGITELEAFEKAIKYIARNAPKLKKELIQISAIAEDITEEEAATRSFAKNALTFKEVFSDKDLVAFFKSVIG